MIVDISAIAVRSVYPPVEDDSVSSVSELSVVNPIDYTRVNYAGWWDERHILVSQVNGDVCVMTTEWERVSEWERFDVGCLARCSSQHALIISCARDLLVDCDDVDHLHCCYHVTTMEGVTPWKKYLNCIANRMMGEAAKLASAYQLDTDLMYSFRG